MSNDMSNVEFARNNEAFAQTISEDYPKQPNWVVTVRFYSLLHYVEQTLNRYGYNSKSHHDRKEKIRECRQIDDRMRKLYRRLEDLSKMARYDCIEMDNEDLEKSLQTLENGKEVLGYSAGGGGSKYSTS